MPPNDQKKQRPKPIFQRPKWICMVVMHIENGWSCFIRRDTRSIMDIDLDGGEIAYRCCLPMAFYGCSFTIEMVHQ